MRTPNQSDLKCSNLRKSATLNPHPEQVNDVLFQSHLFFDPRDLVQVKYEMLRRVIIDGHTVDAATAAFGFSRVRWYQLRQRFASQGLVGLLPQSKGPRQASKLTDEILVFILQTMRAEPELRATEMPMRVVQQFGVSVHLRSIERALARSRKKARTMPTCRTHLPWLQSGPDLSAWNGMKLCVARCLSPGAVPVLPIWKWRSSNARDWQRG
jgi:transposase